LRRALAQQPGLGKTLKVDFKGEGFIHVDDRTVTNEDAPADCTVVVACEDLVSMVKGQLDPMSAMMRGRLRIAGDLSVAMRLQSMLRDPG
jgi:putative sterol carrier protein